MIVFVAILLFTTTTPSVSQTGASPESILIDSLLKSYKPFGRPVQDPSDAVDVYVGFAFSAVVGLDENDQRLTCHGIVKIDWDDPFLAWEPSHFSNITEVYVPHDKVWRPDLVVLNSMVSMAEPIQTEGGMVRLRNNGSLTWMQSGMFQTSCSVDITFFPFDRQSCGIGLGSNSFNKEFVNVQLRVEKRSVYRDSGEKIRENSQWEVQGEDSLQHTTSHGARNIIIFTVHLKRQSVYFIMNVVLPSLILSFLNIFVLIIPHELSDKVGVGTTLVLAYVVFLLKITDSTPANSDQIPFVSVVLLVVMTISAIDVAVLVVFLRCLQNASSGPPPTWLLCVTRCGKFASSQRQSPEGYSKNSAGEAWVNETSGQDKPTQNKLEDSEVWRSQWTAVICRLERGVIVLQTLIVLTMFSSIPCLHFSLMN